MKMHKYNLILLPDYMDDPVVDNKVYVQLNNKINFYKFNWMERIHENDEITFELLKNLYVSYLESLKIKHEETIIIGKGIMGLILCWLHKHYQFKKVILINPFFSTNIINPYTNKIASYKSDIGSYWKQVEKEYYNPVTMIENRNNDLFLIKYVYRFKHFAVYDKVMAFINDYSNLKIINRYESNYDLNNFTILLGQNDKVISIKKTLDRIEYINKKHNNSNNLKIEIISCASHHIEYDKPVEFLELIQRELN